MPLTASITGIDGAGKSTVSEMVTASLSPDIRIAKISRPVYTVTELGKEMRYVRLMKAVDKIHGIADRRTSKKLSLAANAVDVILQGRLIEPGLIKDINPELVLGTRDYLVDPAVYATFYSRLLAGRTTERRVNVFQGITGSSIRDIIFFLTVPPDEAVARIERRMEAEKVGEKNPSRLKWRHMHEEVEHLENLQAEYYKALDVMRKKGTPDICEIDTSRYTQSEVADIISSTLRSRIKSLRAISSQALATV